MFYFFFFFFFQSEDGIRDFHVTGVQTCALPICRDVIPDPIVTPAGFQQQHPVARIRRKTVGQDAASRSGANDDVVVFAVNGFGMVHNLCLSANQAFYDRAEREALHLSPSGRGKERHGNVFDSTISKSAPGRTILGPGNRKADRKAHFARRSGPPPRNRANARAANSLTCASSDSGAVGSAASAR